MTIRGTVLGLAGLSLAMLGFLLVQANPPVTPINQAPSALMKSKLVKSQDVLEGLLRKDFAAIARGAQDMKHISEAAAWPRARDEVYEHFSVEFRRQCNQLESLADELNHQGAMFTYLQMTTTCVNCHDYVRDSLRIADRGPQGGVQLIPSVWPQRGANGSSTGNELRQPTR